jgi:predicted enzyme related to lactoylglutathione lyase
MPTFVLSLGWFIRFARPEQCEALRKFYAETLGLPFLRGGTGHQKLDVFWAGEALLAELIWESEQEIADPLDADPATAQTVPIFRVHDIDLLAGSLRAKGVTVLDSVNRDGYLELFIADPSGCLIGLRDLNTPKHSHDVEAARRRARGEGFNPGCGRMPKGWQELGWIRQQVKDLAAMTRFYSSVLGLAVLDANDHRAWLDLGDNSVLELVGGGRVVALPKSRRELAGCFNLRVQDLEALKSAVRAAGGGVVHELLQSDRYQLSYIADPEGHLLGIEESYHPEKYPPGTVCFPEDLEAQRRWSERVFATL